MHHNVNALARAIVSGPPFTYSFVSNGVQTAISSVTPSSMVMDNVISLLSLVSASLSFSVRTI